MVAVCPGSTASPSRSQRRRLRAKRTRHDLWLQAHRHRPSTTLSPGLQAPVLPLCAGTVPARRAL
eukprot:6542247-Lingulodinium_polyedra.AAC.1